MEELWEVVGFFSLMISPEAGNITIGQNVPYEVNYPTHPLKEKNTKPPTDKYPLLQGGNF